MFDPFQLLIACAFAAVFMFAVGLDIGFKFGRATRQALTPDINARTVPKLREPGA